MYHLLEYPVYEIRSQVAFSDLPHTELDPNDRAELLGIVSDRLHDAGLEVETMSYGRIGPRNPRQVMDRSSNLVVSGRPAAYSWRRSGKRSPAWLDYEALRRSVGNLYPLYREPGRHVAALAAEGRSNY
jgi:hypothetical protein